MKKSLLKLKPVVVTTAYRGIFFGYAKDTSGDQITLENARLCVYWSTDVQGFMGLASKGPTSNCRIGPPATIALRNITSVLEVTKEAEEAWNKSVWRV